MLGDICCLIWETGVLRIYPGSLESNPNIIRALYVLDPSGNKPRIPY